MKAFFSNLKTKFKSLTKLQLSLLIAGIVVIVAGGVTAGIMLTRKSSAPVICLVQFESSGGSKIDEQDILPGEKITKPDDPVKVGFKFLGWYFNDEIFDFEKPINQNIKLTALWESDGTTNIFTIYFDSVDGTIISPIQVSEGYTITEPVAPLKNGYRFIGWYLEENKFDFNTPITQNILLTAKWEEDASKKDNTNNSSNNNSLSNGSNTNNENVNNNNSNINSSITWESLVGTWYLTGTDDITINISKKSDGYWFESKRFMYSPAGINYSSGQGGGGVGSIQPHVFAQVYNITKVDTNSLTVGGKYVFYKTPNYPSHTVSELETLKNNIEGIWYLEGYNKDVYIKFNYGIRNNEKVVFYEQNNYSGTNGEIYPTSSGCVGYFNYYNLNTPYGIGMYGYSYSNGYIYANINGKTLKFSKTPTLTPTTGITLSQNNATISIGNGLTLTASITPSNASNKKVIWSSSNPSIASVGNNGYVYANASGNATITAVTEDGGYTATCNITVPVVNVSGITLDRNTTHIYVGKTDTIAATVTPSSASNKNITWSSNNENVATVNNGVITGNAQGTAIITATTSDGGYKATCTVTVSYPALSVTGSIGHTTIVSGSTTSSGIQVEAKPSGGTGTYTYYYIKLYYNDTLIGETTNTSSNKLFVSTSNNGTYKAEITIKDSNGTTASTTTSITKN